MTRRAKLDRLYTTMGDDDPLKSQMHVWKSIYSYINPMVLQSAIQLRLPDILHAHPLISLADLASHLSPPPSGLSPLRRIMRFLVHDGIFSDSATDPETSETLYSPTSISQWLLTPAEGSSVSHCRSLAGIAMLQMAVGGTIPFVTLKLTKAVLAGTGTTTFDPVKGLDFWSVAATDSEFNEIFNTAMTCTSNIFLDAVLPVHKDIFSNLTSLVDVGGGVGATLGRITDVCPNLIGINFDLPHVVVEAPKYPNVAHVGGNMFEEIPKADAVMLKLVLHNHSDKECLKILANCRRALSQKNSGKLIIIDMVLDPEDKGALGDIGMQLDMLMFVLLDSKERTEREWRELLELGGFNRCNFIKIPAILSIIEAFLY